jgi:hypothetical protein
MQRTKTLTALLDLLGAGSLIAAGIALLNATSIIPVAPQAEALGFFAIAFFTAVAAFALARLLQIAGIIRSTSSPRRHRADRAAAAGIDTPADTTPPVPNPFQRAA